MGEAVAIPCEPDHKIRNAIVNETQRFLSYVPLATNVAHTARWPPKTQCIRKMQGFVPCCCRVQLWLAVLVTAQVSLQLGGCEKVLLIWCRCGR